MASDSLKWCPNTFSVFVGTEVIMLLCFHLFTKFEQVYHTPDKPGKDTTENRVSFEYSLRQQKKNKLRKHSTQYSIVYLSTEQHSKCFSVCFNNVKHYNWKKMQEKYFIFLIKMH